MDIRTLCYRCKSDYETAGYKLIRINNIKSECDICCKNGFDYIVSKSLYELSCEYEQYITDIN